MTQSTVVTAATGSRWQRLRNILIPLTLSVIGAVLVLELGLRHFYQLIPIKLCASDPVLALLLPTLLCL